MSIRFDESLARAAIAAEDADVPIEDGATIFVRNGLGRLSLARAQIPNITEVANALRAKLGAYAAPVAVISGAAADALAHDPTVRWVEETIDGAVRTLRYADRRIVGADWLAEPQPPLPSGPPRLVFGSLKGGVGRSTAIAVLAADLARASKRVLTIDLDIEAPGVGFMLLPGPPEGGPSIDVERLDLRPKYGVIDYLVENGLGGVEDEELFDYVGVSPFAEGFIHVVPATGRVTDDHPQTMMAKLSRALVEDMGPAGPQSVARQVREMVDRFAQREPYDAVLIDARAGLAEITAAPLLALGAEVLLFGTDQPQTFRGYRYMLAHLKRLSGSDGQFDDWRTRVSFVHAKAPASATKRAPFREHLYEMCAEFLYDAEQLGPDGSVLPAEFNLAPDETGPDVPHDATHIEYHPNYDEFNPFGDITQLDPDVYHGPFRHFLGRAHLMLGIDFVHYSN